MEYFGQRLKLITQVKSTSNLFLDVLSTGMLYLTIYLNFRDSCSDERFLERKQKNDVIPVFCSFIGNNATYNALLQQHVQF